MRIRMLETRRGTEDGYTIRQYMREEIYEMGDRLARSFLAAGFAVKAPEEQRANAPKNPARPKRRATNKTPQKVIRKSRKKHVAASV